MPSSEIRIATDSRDYPVMVDPKLVYRPLPIKGKRYYVTIESPEPPEAHS